MVCLDLRRDSKVAKSLENKVYSILVAVIQLLIWVPALFAFRFQSGPVKEQLRESPAGTIVISVILTVVAIGFSALLLVGLLKDNRAYIHAFLVFIIVVIVLFIISTIIAISTQLRRFGLSGIFLSVFIIIVDILSYFIVRNYYLAFISKNQNQNPNVV